MIFEALGPGPSSTLADDPGHIWDVAIIGAGPAGGLAAYLLARAGLQVAVIEKATFPRYKVCGCCLNRAAVESLHAAGLGNILARCNAHPLTQYALACAGSSAHLPLPAGAAISRSRLDAEIAQAAIAHGATFFQNTFVSATSLATPDCAHPISTVRRLELNTQGRTHRLAARVVLAAGGLPGLHATNANANAESHRTGDDSQPIKSAAANSYIGAGTILETGPEFFRPGTIYMAAGSHGYFGWVRLEDQRMNFAAALDPAQVKAAGGLHAAVEAIRREALPAAWPNPFEISAPAAASAPPAWQGTPPLTQRPHRFAEERFFVIGDQSGYVEPFTGEGIAWALESATRVAPLVLQVCRANSSAWDPAWTADWIHTQQSVLQPRRQFCRWVAGSLRHHRLMRALVSVLASWPGLAEPLIRQLNATPEPALIGSHP